MQNRRDFLKAAGLIWLGAACAASRRASAAAIWPPYRDTLAIDAAGGLGGFSFTGVSAADSAKTTAAIRASGLSGVLETVGPAGRFWLGDAAFEKTKATLERWRRNFAAHPDLFLLVRRGDDFARAHREKRIGVVLRFQGSEPLGEDLDRIAVFKQLGVTLIQLTHNRRNLVGDGCMEPGNAGLSNYGHEVVERLNAEKIVVDLAHGAPRTIAEGIRASKAPVLISHAGCRALADLPRNVADTQLRALAERGGVVGIIFWPYLRVDTQPMAIDVIRHIEHAVNVCGEDHVGIGTDCDIAPTERSAAFERDNREQIKGMVEDGIFAKGRPADLYLFIPDLDMANRFDVLGSMLSARGHSDARIAKILGGNFVRVMGEVWADRSVRLHSDANERLPVRAADSEVLRSNIALSLAASEVM